MLKIWISRQKCKKIQKGVVGPIFELHPSNLVRIHIFLSCKNAKNFVTKSQVVLELAKISVSVYPYLEGSLLGHPLKFNNGCQALVLREMFGIKKPNFFKNSHFFCILGFRFVCPRILFMLGTRPVKTMAPPLVRANL